MIHYTKNQIEELIRTDNIKKFYCSKGWVKLAHSVIADNNNECQVCKKHGKYSKAVLVHHVRPLKKYPELAYSRFVTGIDGKQHIQLLPLCFECHEKIHERGQFQRTGFTNIERW